MTSIRVAVDALGGDCAPDEIVAGALEARSDDVQPVLFGPASIDPAGSSSSDDGRDRDEREAGGGRARKAGQLARRRVPVGRSGAGFGRRLGREHGRHARRVAARDSSAPRRDATGDRRRHPVRARAVGADRRGANAESRPEHLLQFATMGAIFAEEILEHRATPRSVCSRSARRPRRVTTDAGGAPAARRLRPELRRQRREPLAARGRSRRRRQRRLHRQRLPEAARGHDPLRLRRPALRDRRTTRGKLGGLLIRPAARRLRARLDPEAHGGAYLLGLRGLVVIAHGNSSRRAIANAIRLAARGVEHGVVTKLGDRLEAEAAEDRVSIPATAESDG